MVETRYQHSIALSERWSVKQVWSVSWSKHFSSDSERLFFLSANVTWSCCIAQTHLADKQEWYIAKIWSVTLLSMGVSMKLSIFQKPEVTGIQKHHSEALAHTMLKNILCILKCRILLCFVWTFDCLRSMRSWHTLTKDWITTHAVTSGTSCTASNFGLRDNFTCDWCYENSFVLNDCHLKTEESTRTRFVYGAEMIQYMININFLPIQFVAFLSGS